MKRKALVVGAAIAAVVSLAGCSSGSHECGTVEQLSTEKAVAKNEPATGGGPTAKADLYPVQITLSDGVTDPAIIYKTGRLNMGWPTGEVKVKAMLPLGDYTLSGYTADGNGCATRFNVAS